MAVFDLVVRQEKCPDRIPEIFDALINTGQSLTSAAHYATTEDRTRNINTIKGLIQDHFVDRHPPVFTFGSGLALQVENCLRRSQIETSRYETKQGFLELGGSREWNRDLEKRILETVCGIANLADHGDIFIGVADDIQDANRVQALDGVTPINIGSRYVVGVEREAAFLNIDVEAYTRRIIDMLRNSGLTEPLKTQVLGNVDSVEFKGLTVIRIGVPKQPAVSFLGEHCFIREGSETKEITGPRILAIQERF
jgi:Putative DNA-binding domain